MKVYRTVRGGRRILIVVNVQQCGEKEHKMDEYFEGGYRVDGTGNNYG